MRKLSMDQEGPVDILILHIVEWITPTLHATGHTPNLITTYSLICGLLGAYCLWRGFLLAFVLLFSLAYLYDCVDGYMARRYKQTSVFGDYYDHISDIVKMGAVLYVFYSKYSFQRLIPIIIILGLLLIGMFVYQGCAQQIVNGEDSKETLDLFQSLCISQDTIQWAKYFSCGTSILAVMGAGIYLELTKKKQRI
jgi:phosphatidylglycerophosphate synthase